MRGCVCPQPNPKGATPNQPHGDSVCVKCSKYIAPEWTDIGPFFDRLEESIFPLGVLRATLPSERLQEFRDFRRQAEDRHDAGREKFGTRFFGRSNPMEAQEEAADLANYCAYELLTARRNGDEEETALALSAAEAAFQAWSWLNALSSHHHRAYSEGVLS